MTPPEVVEMVKASRLVGRGGAGFPTGLKWELVAREPLTPKYLVANAEEGEPGTFKDLPILTRIPHRLIEGMLIGAFAVGATEGVIVCRGEFMEPQRILREAIAEAEAAGLLGERILGTDFSFKLWVYRTAGAYICGEETSLLEALEGKPGMPRIRPPFPVNAGLWARPTALNNVETFANVPGIILEGAAPYAALGTEKNSGTKGYCISGHVNKPGVYEIPFGVTLRSLIDDYAGGILDGRAFKAVFPGGASSSLPHGRAPRPAAGLPPRRPGRLDARLGGVHGGRRGGLHGRGRAAPGALLPARVVRQVHPLPRRDLPDRAPARADEARRGRRPARSTTSSTSPR